MDARKAIRNLDPAGKGFPFLIVLIFLAFIVYKAGYVCIKDGICEIPAPLDVLLISLSLLLIIILYRMALGADRNKVIAIIIAASLVAQLSIYTFKMDEEWKDPRGYCECAEEIHDNGLLYFLNNYHHFCGSRLITEAEMESINSDLDNMGLGAWKDSLWNDEMCEVAPDRRAQHPPFWMIVISLFYLMFGVSDLSAMIAVWTVTALVAVAFYFLLREFAKDDMRTLMVVMVFLLITSPYYMFMSYSPMNHQIISLIGLLSTLFLVRAVKTGSMVNSFLCGLFLSLGLVTHLTFMTMYLPFLLIIAFSGMKRDAKLKVFCALLLSSLILPTIMYALGYNILLNLVTAKNANVRAHIIHEYYYPWYLASVEKMKFLSWVSLPVSFLLILRLVKLARERSLGKDRLRMLSGLAFLLNCLVIMFAILTREVSFRYLSVCLPMIFLIPMAMVKRLDRNMHLLIIALTYLQTMLLLFTT